MFALEYLHVYSALSVIWSDALSSLAYMMLTVHTSYKFLEDKMLIPFGTARAHDIITV